LPEKEQRMTTKRHHPHPHYHGRATAEQIIEAGDKRVHEKLPSPEWILDACGRRQTTLDNPGWCTACGAECEGVEPDARDYPCESCGSFRVYGCEEFLEWEGIIW
jgi:hypothetical protein